MLYNSIQDNAIQQQLISMQYKQQYNCTSTSKEVQKSGRNKFAKKQWQIQIHLNKQINQ